MKPHATDWVSLAFGLVFLGVAALWLTSRFATLTAATVGWTVVGGLVVLGAAGMTSAIASSRRHTDDHRP